MIFIPHKLPWIGIDPEFGISDSFVKNATALPMESVGALRGLNRLKAIDVTKRKIEKRFPEAFGKDEDYAGFVSENGFLYLICFSISPMIIQVWYEIDINKKESPPRVDLDSDMRCFIEWIIQESGLKIPMSDVFAYIGRLKKFLFLV
jgi:hypothetical protein